jgi:hypothetical protein
MKHCLLLVLLLSFASCVFAADSGRFTPVSGATLAISAPARLTLQRGLAKKERDLVVYWFKSGDGSKQKRFCDFLCTNDCYQAYLDCRNAGGSHPVCCAQWRDCITYCCTEAPSPCNCVDGFDESCG